MSRRLRAPLLWSAAGRGALGIAAIPLAPFLYREHFIVLVLLRPTKEVLLAAGFLVRRGDISLGPVLAAAIPLTVFGVWHFYFLGKAYCDEIKDADLPGIAGRLLPPSRINKLAEAVEDKGVPLVLIGRLAAFPSTLVAAAAGTSDMPTRRFLVADGIGALLSVAEVVGLGYAFGEAYEHAGPWITGFGIVATLLMITLLGRALMKKSGADRDDDDERRNLLNHLRRVRKEQGVRAALRAARSAV